MVATSVKGRCPRLCDALTATLGTLICALVVLLFDVVADGNYMFSVLVFPIWFLVAVVRTIAHRPSLGVAAVRILVPLITVLLVVANHSLQNRIAMGNAAQLIQACEQYREANGAYPQRLGDLVPHYLSSVPRAKYCLTSSEFSYHEPPRPRLVWYEFPPFGRWVYNFDAGDWRYVD